MQSYLATIIAFFNRLRRHWTISFIVCIVVRFCITKVGVDRVMSYWPRGLSEKNTFLRIYHSRYTINTLILTCATSWVGKPTPMSQFFHLVREIRTTPNIIRMQSNHTCLTNAFSFLKNEIKKVIKINE